MVIFWCKSQLLLINLYWFFMGNACIYIISPLNVNVFIIRVHNVMLTTFIFRDRSVPRHFGRCCPCVHVRSIVSSFLLIKRSTPFYNLYRTLWNGHKIKRTPDTIDRLRTQWSWHSKSWEWDGHGHIFFEKSIFSMIF